MAILPRLYSDNDVAGMLYAPGDDPDTVLAEFMRLLLAEGWDVLGILQRRVADAPSKSRSVEFVLAPEMEWPEAGSDEGRYEGRASDRLPELGHRLAGALDRKPDLILLNRFGRAELEGGGLVEILSAALVDIVPIAVAVPIGLRDAWVRSTGGLAVSVRPDAQRLLHWWRSLGNGPRSQETKRSG
ncbi:DUF2478 domain-containing protein [Aureimonas sp. AU20]|uniref:DUF2478 domain-containing protein n=1 Tax=Aureimonas sp. AU20 TaxID=1349819 RepID=UPI0007223231|nr:DUF2478 domain-containing protein [Aureimonas sp. AU20]ALN75575.1 hypothetical protein M673_22795 [Aureimonas sp. AU20]